MNSELALDIGRVHVPDAGPVFLTALVVHIAAGLTCIVAGLLATTARKQPGGHPRAGTVYLYGIGTVFVTATVMSALRWQRNWHLFVIATVALSLALLGWWARRRQPRRWIAWHGVAMAGSYIALFTGFYVDNGHQLPLWDRLPPLMYWLLPTAIGAPLTWAALVRNGAIRRGRLDKRGVGWAAYGPSGPSLGRQTSTRDNRRRPAAPKERAGQPPRDGG